MEVMNIEVSVQGLKDCNLAAKVVEGLNLT